MKRKILLINYKAYKESFDNGLKIAGECAKLSKSLGIRAIVAPPYSILRETSRLCETIGQHIDDVEPGAFTGHVTWYDIKNSGATGTLINHSERKLSTEKIKNVVGLCIDNDLFSFVCASSLREARQLLTLKPYAIAYEPPELIGGNVSVTSAKPEVIAEFVELVNSSSKSLALIGAGIKTAEDVRKSIEFGCDGVLVASGILKSKEPVKAINELAYPLRD